MRPGEVSWRFMHNGSLSGIPFARWQGAQGRVISTR